jgi:short chain dehydrogenase
MQPDTKIAVDGATGRVGRHLVDVLEARGHDVVPISRSSGVDLITGEGLAQALEGVDYIIDTAPGLPPSRRRRATSSPPRPGEVSYVPEMRTQLIAAQTVAEAWAVVTAASSGLGREFALALVERGYSVLAVARRGERLRALADEVDAGRRPAPPAYAMSYSSRRRIQTAAWRSPIPRTIVSLRPRGARSSHWYMPQRLSSPRMYAE